MARAAVLGRLGAGAPTTRLVWREATVREIRPEGDRASTLVLVVPGWPGHLAGQHVDVRLTAEDGYQAQRSYSIASAPEDEAIELTVERIDDGEVSPYLADEVRPGDVFELRGPIGGYFTWHAGLDGPLLLLGGGSGVVPLRAMLRHRAAAGARNDTRLLVSARSPAGLLYRSELESATGDGLAVHVTLTREHPAGWSGFERRIDAEMLAEVGPPAAERPRVYLCGPTPFVERAADLLVELGHEPSLVHAERFGPTGG